MNPYVALAALAAMGLANSPSGVGTFTPPAAPEPRAARRSRAEIEAENAARVQAARAKRLRKAERNLRNLKGKT